ncbi:MAG: hypothetical protein ABH852_06135 [Methanobacteriota archaeon]
MSTLQIGKKYEISQGRVLRVLVKHGIPRRPLPEAMRKAARKYYIDEDYFSNIDSELKAYTLGYFIAEAYLRLKIHGCSEAYVKVSINELEHLQKLLSLFSKYPVRIVCGSKEPVSKVEITSTGLVKDLNRWGVPFPKEQARFPKINHSLFNHFIRGAWDGDGTIYKHHGQWTFAICGSYFLIEKIQQVLVRNCNVRQVKIWKDTRKETLFYLQYMGNKQVPRILRWLYNQATIYFDKKYYKAQCCLAET